MAKCPNCGEEVGEEYYFCKFCGAKLGAAAPTMPDVVQPAEDNVKNAVLRRFDALKNRDENAMRGLVDTQYTKFDDWPPHRRQEAEEALRNEFGAFRVLSNYSYEIKDLDVKIFGDAAVATFHVRYQGEIRNRRFEVVSRATYAFAKRSGEWKLVHEHLSRFPEERRRGFFG